MEIEDDELRSNKRKNAAIGRLINEFLYPLNDEHSLDAEHMERLRREADAAAAEEPDAAEIKAIENVVDLLVSLRGRTELLRGKVVKNVTVTICEDHSGFLGAELHHGKDDVDAPNELCACVFGGPEELLDLLRGEQAGQWYLQDERMPGE